MKGSDPEGLTGPRDPLPDFVYVKDPPEDKIVSEPSSEQKEPTSFPPAAPVEDPYQQQPEGEGYQEDAYVGESAAPF